MKKKNLKIDLLKNLILNTFTVVGLIIIIISLVMTNFTRREHRLKNKALAESVSFNVETYLNEIENVLFDTKNLLESNDIMNNIDEYDLQSLLDSRVFNYDQMKSLQILNKDGLLMNVSPYDDELINLDYSRYDYYTEVKTRSLPYWSNIFYVPYSKEPLAAVSLRTQDYVIVGILDLAEFGELVNKINVTEKSTIAITDSVGVYSAHTNIEHVYLRERAPNFDILDQVEKGVVKSVDYEGRKVGVNASSIGLSGWKVIIYQHEEDLKKQIMTIVFLTLVISFLSSIISIYFSKNKIDKISASLSDLALGTQIISDGEYHHELKESDYFEIEELRKLFIDMTKKIESRELKIKESEEEIIKMNEYLEDQVTERTLALKTSNEELEKSLDSLQHAQKILIQSEKMASLGQLVASISHEMMTPIGVVVTMASYMEQNVRQFEEKFMTNKLSKRELDEFISEEKESIEVIIRNTQRTKEFVESLKKTSVDQTSMEKRTFNMCETINDSIRSLKIDLNKANVKVVVDCPTEIIIESYPGGISQIILNLVKNSIKHAFRDFENKYVTIDVDKLDGYIEIIIEDNGIGMSQEIISKIFEPYFTTARDEGGSGLGMNIVYNLVTELFKGTIECISEENKGTQFIVRIPNESDD